MRDLYKTHFYQVSGVNLESEIRLPDLIKNGAPADVKIRYGNIKNSLTNDFLRDARFFERPGCRINASAAAMLIEWEKVGRFYICGGAEIIVEPENDVPEEDLQPFLTGPVLSVLFHQRGCLVLHASGVVINNAAVVFLGAKGYGKSTLAAHLQVRGHRLISDDIVPVSFAGNFAQTAPGYPRIKLFEDSVRAVGETPTNLPLVHRFVDKRSYQCAENFSTEPIFLRGIYVLAESKKVSFEKLGSMNAFIEATRNTYLNRYLESLKCLPEHFEKCRKLIQSVPFFMLKRPHDFDVMNAVCASLENHVGELSADSGVYQRDEITADKNFDESRIF